MNMFKPVGAKNINEYMALLDDERRVIIKKLDKLIKESAPSLKPHFAYNMLGYGSFKYKNYKKQELLWPTVALASQKNYVSVYVCSMDGGEYIAEKHKEELGKVSVGKSCIRIKKLEDVNLDVLKKIIKTAEKNPGLTYAG